MTSAAGSDRCGPAVRRLSSPAGVVLTAIAVTLVQWALVTRVAGVDLLVRAGTAAGPAGPGGPGGPSGRGEVVQQVGPGSVAAATLVAGLAGWGLLFLLRRCTRHPARWWTVAATALLLLSLAGPLAAASSLAAGLSLAGLHLLAAAVLVPGLNRSAGLLGRNRCGRAARARATRARATRLRQRARIS
jgi:hypothetical protein